MTLQEKLLNLIHNEVMPDIEEYLDELFDLIASKKEDDEIKEEVLYMQEMQQEFQELINDIHSENISNEEAQEIIDEIIEMKTLKE